MSRKCVTQRFPFITPLRAAQRKAFFYAGMRLDGHTYAKTIQRGFLPYRIFSADNGLFNPNMSFNRTYQENKVFNSKLAAKTLSGLLIKPGETFSFWQVVRYADKYTPYKDGSVVRNGKLCVAYGGGLCQLSNLLFWVLLHSPLVIAERQTHKVKDFPTLRNKEPEGVDATISEGWIDLKVRNETDTTFQIGVAFDSTTITVSLFADKAMPTFYEIDGKDLSYFCENGKVYQEIAIYRHEIDRMAQRIISEKLLYTNLCEIHYQLPKDTLIIEEKTVDTSRVQGIRKKPHANYMIRRS